MKIEIEITKIVVLLRDGGTDLVYVDTLMPASFNFNDSDPYLFLKFETTSNTGIEYVRKNLGIEPEVVDTRK